VPMAGSWRRQDLLPLLRTARRAIGLRLITRVLQTSPPSTSSTYILKRFTHTTTRPALRSSTSDAVHEFDSPLKNSFKNAARLAGKTTQDALNALFKEDRGEFMGAEWKKEEDRWAAFLRERERARDAAEREQMEAAQQQMGGGPPAEGGGAGVRVTTKNESLSGLSGPNNDVMMSIKAFYTARKIDFVGLLKEFREWPHSLQRDSAIIYFNDEHRLHDSDAIENTEYPPTPTGGTDRYMVVFGYGSVVFFNFEWWRQKQCLDMIKRFSSTYFEWPQAEDYGVVLRDSMGGWDVVVKNDFIQMKSLDLRSLRVISGVIGQTVALDHYEKEVEIMLETFRTLNSEVEQTGHFKMKQRGLFRLVARNNTILTDVITKLGLLERSDTAWKYAQYSAIWEGLREEFEVDRRFKNVDFKLNLIQHNCEFFLDIIQNERSDNLEWIIIALISVEICLSLYEIYKKEQEGHHPALGDSPAPYLDAMRRDAGVGTAEPKIVEVVESSSQAAPPQLSGGVVKK